jgi:uncharacterized protein YjiS (DUF1127 family)
LMGGKHWHLVRVRQIRETCGDLARIRAHAPPHSTVWVGIFWSRHCTNPLRCCDLPQTATAPVSERVTQTYSLDTLRLWQQRHRGRRDLLHLNERMLRDIGLNRAAATREAYKAFWQP